MTAITCVICDGKLDTEGKKNPILSKHDSNGKQKYGWSCCSNQECRDVFAEHEEKKNRDKFAVLESIYNPRVTR